MFKWIIWFICSAFLTAIIIDLVFYDFINIDEDYSLTLFVILCLILGYAGMKMRRW